MAPSVREAMEAYWTEHFMLPGQTHPGASAVAEAIEQAREQVAKMVGCEGFEIVFTSGGTEANNLAVLGLAKRYGGGHIVVSALEHESVWQAVESLSPRTWRIDVAAVDSQGRVDPKTLESLLREETRIVCVQLASPVLGVRQPIREIADLCHSHGVPLHCDATQAFGKIPVDIRALRADTLAISAHKMYGPKGCGALYVRRGFSLAPVLYGESREMGLRPGSENVPAWVGFGAAAKLVDRCVADAMGRMHELRDRLQDRLLSQITPTPRVLCQRADSLPNTLVMELEREICRIARRARGVVFSMPRSLLPADEGTRSLRALGIGEAELRRCCSFSLGWTTSQEEIDTAADLFAEAYDYG